MLAKDIKKVLVDKWLKDLGGDIYSEFYTDAAQADLAVLCDDKFVGLEIKSSSDTLKRFIETQRWGYTYFFDDLWLVVDNKHVEKAIELLSKDFYKLNPDPWGLMSIGPRGKLTVHKEPSQNSNRKPLYLVKRLWKADLVQELKAREQRGYSKLTSAKLRRLLLSLIKPEELRPLIRKYARLHEEFKLNKRALWLT